MAGRVEERSRRDNVAETIEETFIKLQAGGAAEQRRDSRDSGEAPARTIQRERRKRGTTRLDLADVFGPTEADGQMAGRAQAVEPDNQRSEQSSQRRQRAAESRSTVQAPDTSPRRRGLEPESVRRIISNGEATDEVETTEAVVALAAPRSTDAAQPATAPPDTEIGREAAVVQGQPGRLGVDDGAELSSGCAQYPEINIFDDGKEIIILAELPGLDIKVLAVTSDGQGLTISGNRRPGPDLEGAQCRWRERSSAPFVRSLQLPDGLVFARATATYRNGILEIRAHKSQPVFKIAVR